MAEQQSLHIQDQNALGWEKSQQEKLASLGNSSGRWKFIVGGLLIVGAIAYLVISSTLMGARFFITVEELINDNSYAGQTVRISGAVIGDTIEQNTVLVGNSERSAVVFTISHIPQEFDDLAEALNRSVNDPNAAQLQIYYEGPMPDLLQHEAQAILTGELTPDGVFHASELLLKCPSRFDNGGSRETLGDDHPELDLGLIDAG